MAGVRLSPAGRAFYSSVGLRDSRLAGAAATRICPTERDQLTPFLRAAEVVARQSGVDPLQELDDLSGMRRSSEAFSEAVRSLPAVFLGRVTSRLVTHEVDTNAEIASVLAAARSGRLPLNVTTLSQLTMPAERELAERVVDTMYEGQWAHYADRSTCYVLSFGTLPIGAYAVRIQTAEHWALGAGIYILSEFQGHWGFGARLREHVFSALQTSGCTSMTLFVSPPEGHDPVPQRFHERLAGRRGVSITRYRDIAARYKVDPVDYPYIFRLDIDLTRLEPSLEGFPPATRKGIGRRISAVCARLFRR